MVVYAPRQALPLQSFLGGIARNHHRDALMFLAYRISKKGYQAKLARRCSLKEIMVSFRKLKASAPANRDYRRYPVRRLLPKQGNRCGIRGGGGLSQRCIHISDVRESCSTQLSPAPTSCSNGDGGVRAILTSLVIPQMMTRLLIEYPRSRRY